MSSIKYSRVFYFFYIHELRKSKVSVSFKITFDPMMFSIQTHLLLHLMYRC